MSVYQGSESSPVFGNLYIMTELQMGFFHLSGPDLGTLYGSSVLSLVLRNDLCQQLTLLTGIDHVQMEIIHRPVIFQCRLCVNIRIKIIFDIGVCAMSGFFSPGHYQIGAINSVRHKMILQNTHLDAIDDAVISQILDHTVHRRTFSGLGRRIEAYDCLHIILTDCDLTALLDFRTILSFQKADRVFFCEYRLFNGHGIIRYGLSVQIIHYLLQSYVLSSILGLEDL